ncbi:MAG: FxsA family protein [Porticoccaceae bacterium]|jgi:UPF0716 protein FxsA|nr:FxsA family protein [Porticoccaceae bacterium]|tara:strand:- start:662 stop:1129 length:468 start_codon:yes stop_codon:yes gene_type:complete
MRALLLLFIVMPIVEMWLLITVGAEIGPLYTIGLVLLTAVIGVQLLRQQGFATLWRGRRKLEEGQLPAQEIVEGIILAVSGALLLTPGFVTDVVGFAGLFPLSRAFLGQLLLSKLLITHVHGHQRQSGDQRGASGSGTIIDGESWDNRGDIDGPK